MHQNQAKVGLRKPEQRRTLNGAPKNGQFWNPGNLKRAVFGRASIQLQPTYLEGGGVLWRASNHLRRCPHSQMPDLWLIWQRGTSYDSLQGSIAGAQDSMDTGFQRVE